LKASLQPIIDHQSPEKRMNISLIFKTKLPLKQFEKIKKLLLLNQGEAQQSGGERKKIRKE
jgi:hypothetical protein